MQRSFLTGLDHIQLTMPAGQEAAARKFYAGLLGLVEEPKPAPLQGRGGCWFHGPGIALHLGVDADFRPASKAHPAFRVRDLDGLQARLETTGAEVLLDETLPGKRRFYSWDPFGNRLEFLEDGA